MITPIIYQNNTIGNVFNYLTLGEDSVNKPAASVEPGEYGYAGFKERAGLEAQLKRHVLGGEETELINIQPRDYPINKIQSTVKGTLSKAYQALPAGQPIEIYLFPTVSEFTKENLGGVDGYTPYQHTIHLYLHPEAASANNFLQEVSYSLAHEYNHAVRFYYFPLDENNRLADAIVNEGFADNFREVVLGGDPSPWSIALTRKEARAAFRKMQPLLDDDDHATYQKVFFGGDDYSLWTGYSVGYYLVKDFLDTRDGLDWQEIIQTPPKEILAGSGW